MKTVYVFTTATCPHCRTAKEILQREGISFVERHADTDPSAQMEMRSQNLMGVPSFKIGEVYFSGLDMEKVWRELDYTIVPCPHCKTRIRVPKGKGKIKIRCRSCGESFEKQT